MERGIIVGWGGESEGEAGTVYDLPFFLRAPVVFLSLREPEPFCSLRRSCLSLVTAFSARVSYGIFLRLGFDFGFDFDEVEEEVEAVREVLGAETVLTGFYSYGEISPFSPGAKCELHNQTMTITAFAEH